MSLYSKFLFIIAQKSKSHKNLELTLYWNKVDIANSDIFNGNESFTSEQLENIMEEALKINSPKFVQLLLENKLYIDEFLTKKRLYDLFNYSKNAKDIKDAPFCNILRNKHKNSSKEIKFSEVKDYLQNLTGIKLPVEFFVDKNCQTNEKVNEPVTKLFIWSVLYNRPEIAMVLLPLAKVFLF